MLLIAFSLNSFAQSKETEGYRPSVGILGAANFNKFRVNNGIASQDYKFGLGWSGGAYLNLPLGKKVSIEPQFLFSSYKYKPKTENGANYSGDITYLSVPVLLKWHVVEKLAILAGPQFNFFNDFSPKNAAFPRQSLDPHATAIVGGVELFPHSRVSVFGKYLHGVGVVNRQLNPNFTGETQFLNQSIEVGAKLRLFGGKPVKPTDTDGDGIPDKEDKCPTTAGLAKYEGCPIPDTDGDGINDEEDKCPNQAGTAKYNGCPIPDTDGDGINDEEDKCPNQAGTAKYNGCPIPDTDGDGINDEEDKCPNQAGLPKYNGCPIPDTDGDGINDEEDKCPRIPGVKENDGCPAIPKFNAANVQFVTGSTKPTAKALKELDDIVAYMKQYPEISLHVNGHTDNVGKEEFNQALSEKRAAAIVDALAKKGVDKSKLHSAGFGMSQPIADNSTAAGKAQNRRVEFKFSQD